MEYCEYEGEEEESHYSTPLLKRRATATAGYAKTTHAMPLPEEEQPPKRSVKRQHHFLFSVGIGMCIFVILLMLWNMVVVPWWHSVTIRWTYGTSQVSIFGADVEHGGVSRFIAFDNDNEIVIVEVINTKSMVYTIPTGTQQNRLVTLSFSDVNHDGKVDIIASVDGEEGSYVLYNTGTSFQWTP